jgi:transcription antitermination factor NusG
MRHGAVPDGASAPTSGQAAAPPRAAPVESSVDASAFAQLGTSSAWAGALRVGTNPWAPAATARWWVLHTLARNEKRVAEALANRGIAHYLPLVSVQHTYAKSRATFSLPLFPGYLFLCGDEAACVTARETRRVAAVLGVQDQARLQRELAHVWRAVESRRGIELYPSIRPGKRCRVTRGPLAGLEGVAIRTGSRCRMYLSVTMLGQSAVVEVDAALLELVE